MTEALEIWFAGFTVGIGASLLMLKIFLPYQLAKQVLSEV